MATENEITEKLATLIERLSIKADDVVEFRVQSKNIDRAIEDIRDIMDVVGSLKNDYNTSKQHLPNKIRESFELEIPRIENLITQSSKRLHERIDEITYQNVYYESLLAKGEGSLLESVSDLKKEVEELKKSTNLPNLLYRLLLAIGSLGAIYFTFKSNLGG